MRYILKIKPCRVFIIVSVGVLLIFAKWLLIPTVIWGTIIMGIVIYALRKMTKINRSSYAASDAVSFLSAHLRKDIGFDDAHARDNPTWRDPLQREIRRLGQRL